MGGRLTAKELAFAAHVSPATTSGHLARLTDAALLAVEKQGRHRYFRLASPLVGQMLESVMAVAGPELRPTGSWRGGEALRTARTCYDHLAGRLGVALADALVGAGHVALTHDGGEVTEPGRAVSARVWRRTGGRQAGVLQAVPGLERAPPAHRRPVGCRAGNALPGPGLDRAAAGFSGGDDHGEGHGRFRRELRHPPDLNELLGGLLLPGAPPNRAYRLCSDGERLIIVGTCDLTR